MVLLLVGAPLAQGLRGSHLFQLLYSSPVFGDGALACRRATGSGLAREPPVPASLFVSGVW